MIFQNKKMGENIIFKLSNKIYSIFELKEIVSIFKNKNLNIMKIYLFGSYARDEAKKTSDIDLYFIVNNNINLNNNEIYDYFLYEIRNTLANNGIKYKGIDILIENESNFEEKKYINSNIENIIAKEGILIYKRNGDM